MTSSTLSLDSLSSPSPTPTPPPVTDNITHTNIDDDSELSELTDDDQDTPPSLHTIQSKSQSQLPPSPSAPPPPPSVPDTANTSHPPTLNRPSSSKKPPTSSPTRHTRTTSSSRRRGAPRKKRSSLVPAPMWGWAEAKPPTTSAPLEEEEEELAGPPRAMEEEEEEPDEPEQEEEEDYDSQDHSAPIDEEEEEEEEEDPGFVTRRRLGPYVNQRLPGIRSIYSTSARARHARRLNPTPSRKFDPDHPEPILNGDEHDNFPSPSGSEYNSPKKKKLTKTRPPVSAGSRKRKTSITRESSGSDHPLPLPPLPPPPPPPSGKKPKRPPKQDQEDEEAVTDVSTARDNSGDETANVDESTPQIPISPSKCPPSSSSKPLSAIASSSLNTAAAALAALAAFADSVETNAVATDKVLKTLTGLSPSAARKSSPVHEPPSLNSSTAEPTPAVSRSRTSSPVQSDVDEEPAEPTSSSVQHRNKRTTRRGAARSKKGSDDWRRRLSNPKKPSIELKIDTGLADEPVLEAVNNDDTEGMDVDGDVDEANEVGKNAEEDVEEEEEEEAEDEVSQHDDEAQPTTEDPGEGDDEPVDPEEGEEEDQEQDAETNDVENEQENENENEMENDEEENEEEPLPDADLEDQEIELQPAHRAEALDVLASIELKFAMLRERVYVEKMEILAWEETMIQASVHPEMQYLQKEMTKRRDKRLELASRKRSYEIANSTKRRRGDEEGVWSWWKLTSEELQTDMIAETNRKRRKLERERRALERPQPIRRIPLPPTELPLLPQPSLRKMLKSYPYVHKPIKRRRHRLSRTYQPKNLVYPEISTLSAMDINHDLEFLYQNRRIPSSSYDMPFGGPLPPLWGQGSPFAHRSGLGGGLLGPPRMFDLARPAGGAPQPNVLVPHGLTYETYAEHSGFGGPRVREPYVHGLGGPSMPLPPLSKDVYLGHSGPSTRNQPSPSHGVSSTTTTRMAVGLGYSAEHDMGPMSHMHIGQGAPNSFPASSSASSSHGMKGVSNGRRSPSSPPHMPNGMAGPKLNGNWMNSFAGGSNGKGDVRMMMHEEEERERLGMRERDRKRAERDKEMERRGDYWEKEYPEPERDRPRDLPSYMAHPSTAVQFGHGPGGVPAPPGPGGDGGQHHHHRPHHHHVLHRHGPMLRPPSPVPTGGAPPIVHSPRSVRDYDMPSAPHPSSEGVMASSKAQPPPRERERDREREREREILWSQRNMDGAMHHSPSMHEYREREKDSRKAAYSMHRPASRPADERGDRTTSSPFVLGPPPPPSSSSSGVHMNGSGASSPKNQAMWAEEASYRMPYIGSTHERSPVQAHRYTPGVPQQQQQQQQSVMSRARPPLPPSPFSTGVHRSPPISPRLTPRSPAAAGLGKALLRGVSPTGQRSSGVVGAAQGVVAPLEGHLKNGTGYSGSSSSSSVTRQGMMMNGDLVERRVGSERMHSKIDRR